MQKKILIHWLIIGILARSGISLSQNAEPAPSPPIIISEIGAFEPTETEWIEIYNRNGTTTDFTNWKFFEDGTNHGLTAFRGDFALKPAQYAVIANKADLFAQKYPAYTGTIFDSNWGNLKEEGEEIGLKDAAGNIIELFTYPTAQNTSLERININLQDTPSENWAPHPTSHSLGQPRQIPEVAPTEPSLSPTTPPHEPPLQPPPPQPITLAPTPPPPPPPPVPISNAPPQAIIQIQSGSLTAYETTTINFDGRASIDPNGDPLTYLWDMGDGIVETTANPPLHKYSQPGTYIVTLTVIDPNGAKSSAQQYIQVLNKPRISAPQSAPQLTPSNLSSPPPESTPQTPPAATQPSPPPKPTANAQIFLPQNALFDLRGYFVFVPETAAKKSVAKKKIKRPAKKSLKKSVKKSAKPTAKKPNVFRNGDLSHETKITEIFPNPGPDDENEEWIEIFNNGTRAVNLGNWMLGDSKKTSPYQIPDTVILHAGAYVIFPKSETKIALNNFGDEIILRDFEGNTMDHVAYEKSKPGHSYALVQFDRLADLVASKNPLPPRKTFESTWEWIDEPSPGKANPSFEKIGGVVSRLLAGGDSGDRAFNIALPNGSSKTIRFTEETLDPLMAEVILREGTSVEVQTKKRADGAYDLKKIDGVHPAPATKEERKIPWLIVSLVLVGIFLNVIPLVRALRNYLRERR